MGLNTTSDAAHDRANLPAMIKGPALCEKWCQIKGTPILTIEYPAINEIGAIGTRSNAHVPRRCKKWFCRRYPSRYKKWFLCNFSHWKPHILNTAPLCASCYLCTNFLKTRWLIDMSLGISAGATHFFIATRVKCVPADRKVTRWGKFQSARTS